MEELLKANIKKNPKDPMNYYYLGKELMKRPLRDIESVTVIEELFKQSIKLGPSLWAPKILLGELLYKIGRFKEAEPYFKESLGKFPGNLSVKEYLVKCVSKSSKPSGTHEQTKRDSLYLLENNVREFIRILLEENFKKDWWRMGIPKRVRAKCAARREEGLEEEKEADLLLFADFYDYKIIIESNKNIFSSYIDIKEWGRKLNHMEPVRNAIAHNRPLTSAPVRVKEYYQTFQKVLDKARGKTKLLKKP
jgi:tetratricopeptide (TPR) repeat protein